MGKRYVPQKSDPYFLDALRSVLGLGPLPRGQASGKEHKRLNQQRTHPIPWHSGETDGCHHVGRRGSKL